MADQRKLPTITHEQTIDGYAVFRDTYFKVAVISTKHDNGLRRDGVIIFEPLPRELWGVHFTSPHMTIDLLEAVLKSLPGGE